MIHLRFDSGDPCNSCHRRHLSLMSPLRSLTLTISSSAYSFHPSLDRSPPTLPRISTPTLSLCSTSSVYSHLMSNTTVLFQCSLILLFLSPLMSSTVYTHVSLPFLHLRYSLFELLFASLSAWQRVMLSVLRIDTVSTYELGGPGFDSWCRRVDSV